MGGRTDWPALDSPAEDGGGAGGAQRAQPRGAVGLQQQAVPVPGGHRHRPHAPNSRALGAPPVSWSFATWQDFSLNLFAPLLAPPTLTQVTL